MVRTNQAPVQVRKFERSVTFTPFVTVGGRACLAADQARLTEKGVRYMPRQNFSVSSQPSGPSGRRRALRPAILHFAEQQAVCSAPKP